MINFYEVNETNKMIEKENLDVRTITMGISLLDCIDSDLEKLKANIYNKIYVILSLTAIIRLIIILHGLSCKCLSMRPEAKVGF